jgi:hypothetical protein
MQSNSWSVINLVGGCGSAPDPLGELTTLPRPPSRIFGAPRRAWTPTVEKTGPWLLLKTTLSTGVHVCVCVCVCVCAGVRVIVFLLLVIPNCYCHVTALRPYL